MNPCELAVVLDFFGEMTVDQIDDDTVQNFIRYLDDLAYKREVEKAAAAYAKLKSAATTSRKMISEPEPSCANISRRPRSATSMT